MEVIYCFFISPFLSVSQNAWGASYTVQSTTEPRRRTPSFRRLDRHPQSVMCLLRGHDVNIRILQRLFHGNHQLPVVGDGLTGARAGMKSCPATGSERPSSRRTMVRNVSAFLRIFKAGWCRLYPGAYGEGYSVRSGSSQCWLSGPFAPQMYSSCSSGKMASLIL